MTLTELASIMNSLDISITDRDINTFIHTGFRYK